MMEKNIWTLTFIIVFLAIYIEATFKINLNPIWGYVCAIDFPIIFGLFINLVNTVKPNEHRRQISEDDKH